jgi:hypothetical protein
LSTTGRKNEAPAADPASGSKRSIKMLCTEGSPPETSRFRRLFICRDLESPPVGGGQARGITEPVVPPGGAGPTSPAAPRGNGSGSPPPYGTALHTETPGVAPDSLTDERDGPPMMEWGLPRGEGRSRLSPACFIGEWREKGRIGGPEAGEWREAVPNLQSRHRIPLSPGQKYSIMNIH